MIEETTTQQVPQVQPVYHVQKNNSGWRAFWFFATAFILICGICGLLPLMLLVSTGDSGTKTEKGIDDLTYTFVMGKEESNNKLLAVYLDQPILTSSQDYEDDVLSSLLVGQYIFGYRVKDQLIKAANDTTIKGVILFINSPGGTIVGSRAVADGVSYYREKTGKPVYAYIEDMAASGAYWSAASTDKIYAEQGSLTGSIGVLLGPFEYYDKLVTLGGVGTENGISINYITGGKYKDFGNPTKKLSQEELTILQESIDSEYNVFVDYVSTRRQIPIATIKNDIKALVYGAEKAKTYGLIDQIGNREMVLTDLSTKAGVAEDYKVVKISSNTSLFGSFFASLSKDFGQKTEAPARMCALCGRTLYLYGNPLDY